MNKLLREEGAECPDNLIAVVLSFKDLFWPLAVQILDERIVIRYFLRPVLLALEDALKDGRKDTHQLVMPLDIQTYLSPKCLVIYISSNLLYICHDIT